jgi:uncharacterized repeat protein (TIGR01451 family)
VENHSPTGDMIASVLNNTCRSWGTGAGINFQVGDVGNINASANLTVTGNTITNPGAGTQHGVQGNFGAVATGTNAVCFDFNTNTVNLGGAPPNAGSDLRLRQRNGSTVRLPGYLGGNTNTAQVATFEIGQNTLQDPPSQVSAAVAVPPGGGFIGGAACTSPIVPLSMTSELTASASSARVSVTDSLDPKRDDILYAVRGENPGKSQVGELTPSEAYAMLQAATARWADAGLSASNFAKMQSLTVEVADLPAGQLATANSSKIVLDATAAGYGWFFDTTPSDDNEFAVPVPNKERQSIETSAADRRMDLLTVLMRELGTQMSRGKSALRGSHAWLMQNSLGIGTRRAPAFKVETGKRLGTKSGDAVLAAIKPKSQERDATYQQVASVSGRRNSRSASYRHHPTLVPRAAVPTSFADVMLNIGVLPAGKSITITFNATVDNPFTGVGSTVCNQGTVSGTNFADVLTDDPDVGGAADPTCTPIDLPQANLSITKTDGAADEVPGTSVTYTIVATNIGPSPANGVSVTDNFPGILTGVTYTSVAAGGATGNTAGPAGGNISDTLNMPSGSSVTYTVNATIQSSATGNLSNTATITAPAGVVDPVPGNNSATDTDTLTPSSDVAVDKSGPASVLAGANITYTISVTNNGPSDATSLSFADAVPANTTFVSVTTPAGWTRTDAVAPGGTGTITFTAASLAASATSNFTLVVNANAGLASGTIITNTVNVGSGSADPVPGNNTDSVNTTVQNDADLSISKTFAPPSPISAGTNVTYTILVTNNGPSPASNVTFSDPVPAGTTVVTQTNPAGWSCNSLVGSNGTITCTKSGMANGETATLTVVAAVGCNVANGATINNTATVSAASPSDSNLANNTSTAMFTVSNPAPVVTATVTTSMLSQNNHELVNVGLSASATDGPCGNPTVTVQVFGDEDDETPTSHNEVFSPDAKDIASGTLRLRQERLDSGDGRVYLIVVTATDAAGQTSFATVTVVVPKSSSASNVAAVQAEAAAAKAFADANNGAPPPGYFVIGDGPIIGNKQ